MAAGIMGPTLRRLEPLAYSPQLEASIFGQQDDARRRIFRREYVWVSQPLIPGQPQPEWVYLPASLGGEWVCASGGAWHGRLGVCAAGQQPRTG